MLVQQLKEHIVEGNSKCICTNQSQNSISSHLRTFILKFFSVPKHGGPIVNSGYGKISYILSVNSA